MKLNFKKIFSRTLQPMFLLFVGIVVTFLSARLPFDGFVIYHVTCGSPSGLPFAFTGILRNTMGPLNPLCVTNFVPTTLMLDVVFWALSFYLVFRLSKKLMQNKPVVI